MAKKPTSPERLLELHFEDNSLLSDLYGVQNSHLNIIEKKLNVDISTHGNVVTITGDHHGTNAARDVFDALWDRLQNKLEVSLADVEGALRIATSNVDTNTKERALTAFTDKPKKITTKRKHISPRSTTQSNYLEALDKYDLVFGIGPAGTGKTYLAVAKGVEMLMEKKVSRLVITRPAVEAGERLGFLPGDLQEKIDPYLRPVYDALYDMLPSEDVVKLMAQGDIEIAPLAYMRGRTLSDACIILDEAQNTTTMQMKMFLTRLGENGRMVISGDVSQTDLPNGQLSGLQQAVELLQAEKEVAVIEFSAEDVVRHPLVAKVIKAYDRLNKKND